MRRLNVIDPNDRGDFLDLKELQLIELSLKYCRHLEKVPIMSSSSRLFCLPTLSIPDSTQQHNAVD